MAKPIGTILVMEVISLGTCLGRSAAKRSCCIAQSAALQNLGYHSASSRTHLSTSQPTSPAQSWLVLLSHAELLEKLMRWGLGRTVCGSHWTLSKPEPFHSTCICCVKHLHQPETQGFAIPSLCSQLTRSLQRPSHPRALYSPLYLNIYSRYLYRPFSSSPGVGEEREKLSSLQD